MGVYYTGQPVFTSTYTNTSNPIPGTVHIPTTGIPIVATPSVKVILPEPPPHFDTLEEADAYLADHPATPEPGTEKPHITLNLTNQGISNFQRLADAIREANRLTQID